MMKVLAMFALFWGIAASMGTTQNNKCERLKTSLTYPQEKAPKDITAALPLIVEKVNRELEGVVDVEVLFEGGDMHRKVGEHIVQCSVTRLVSVISPDHLGKSETRGRDEQGRDVITQCFQVPFTILDTDECQLPVGHAMRHRCNEPAMCINTVGSYECLCPTTAADFKISTIDESFWSAVQESPRTAWEKSLDKSSESSCSGMASTHGCCDAYAHSTEGAACRASFRCPVDPCRTRANDCSSKAICQLASSPLDVPSYTCQCPDGLMGNGHKCRKGIDPKPRPMVKFDGVTPTEETVRNDYYCDCTRVVIDVCDGFPKCTGKHEICVVTADNKPVCACKPGFVDDGDGFGCVDETPPILRLRNDPDGNGITRLKQGDFYKEYAVDIIDENAEDYLRSLKITYSRALPPGCLYQVGSFHVNYTVATPWTEPPYVRVTRNVIVEDIDECSIDVKQYMTQCPQLVPRCDTDSGAVCKNTPGGYTCQCPDLMEGDGFKPIPSITEDGRYIDAPNGYKGGTGCRDIFRPNIELLGPNPKVFRTCKCGNLDGVMSTRLKRNNSDMDLYDIQRSSYESDIKKMISETNGAELCATHSNKNPKPEDCVRAVDLTSRGNVNIFSRVVMGDLVQMSPLKWSIPYKVLDDAGNSAITVYRDIVVEEVDLSDVETRIRNEILADKDREIKEAVKKALEKERAKKGGVSSCPPCPPCKCPETVGLSRDECDSICNERMRTVGQVCFTSEGIQYHGEKVNQVTITSLARGFYKFLKNVLSPSFLLLLLTFFTALIFLVLFQRYQNRNWEYYTTEDELREQAMQDSVRYFRSPEQQARINAVPRSMPPRTSVDGERNGAAVGSGIFSPQENRIYGTANAPEEESIYRTMNPITPMRSNGTPPQFGQGTTPYGAPRNMY